jgi:methionyl-tRNA synthetase
MSKVLSAVAWPYANGPRHLGHVAGFAVPSDVFSGTCGWPGTTCSW